MGTSCEEECVEAIVQEIARNELDELPKRFIRKEDERPTGASPPASSIPVVDLQLLLSSGESRRIEMKKLGSALQSWGFFQAVGHGISTSLLDAVQELSTEFFKLPLQEKKKWLISPDEDALQGYGNDIDGSDEQILNWSDRLYLVVLPEENRKLKFWPENPPTFRKILHEYTTNVKQMADQILRTMAESVGLKEDYFIDCFGQRSGMFVRFNYYPPCPRPDLVLGIQAHSDAAGITIVMQDKEVRGLQVLKEEKWLEIPIIPHALLVNLGDQMEIMSNGIFKSPVHRVVTNSEKERMSVAMFYAPNPEQEIEPAEGLIDEEKPRLYKKVIVKDYLAAFVDSYMHGKRAIHNVKISGMHA